MAGFVDEGEEAMECSWDIDDHPIFMKYVRPYYHDVAGPSTNY